MAQKRNEKYDEYVRRELTRINKQVKSGYLSKKKIKDMQPEELIVNEKLIKKEIERRGIGMLFGV